MQIDFSKEDLDNLLKVLWVAVQSPQANESFAGFYVHIKDKIRVHTIMEQSKKKEVENVRTKDKNSKRADKKS